jgi:tRNA-binding protein
MTDQMPSPLSWDDFLKVDLRVGTIVHAEPNVRAQKPAYVLTVDLGEVIGTRTSSAQLTRHYQPADLIGRQVLAVINFLPKRIAGIRSEILVCGLVEADGGVVLVSPDRPVPNGLRLA